MLEKFLKQTSFQDNEDYREHLEFIVPERFNFAYDVMDAWAEECPDALALWWVNDKGDNRRISFGEMKELTDRTAAYFSSLGIGSGDMVMLILKRRLEFWLSVLALHKIGAITIPATHMLTSKDIVYRNRKAHIKAIVCVGDTYVL